MNRISIVNRKSEPYYKQSKYLGLIKVGICEAVVPPKKVSVISFGKFDFNNHRKLSNASNPVRGSFEKANPRLQPHNFGFNSNISFDVRSDFSKPPKGIDFSKVTGRPFMMDFK